MVGPNHRRPRLGLQMAETMLHTRPPASPSGPRGVRDRELVTYVGRHGLVAVRHVMAAMGAGRTASYRRIAACVEAGLLERLELLREEPGLLRATRAGLRFAGLGLPVAVVSPGAVDHWLRCASMASLLAAEFEPERLLTERELRLAEHLGGRPIASAGLGRLPSGQPRLHRPDLAVLGPVGAVAIEVELSPKAPRRLEAILRGWRRADQVAEVRYYCAPGAVTRGLERAVAKTHTAEKVRILEAPIR
jgi:hypothetical protein